MDSEWVAAIASLVSAFIVAVTAVAAFRQLKHYRNANDMVVYLRLIDLMDSPGTLAARAAASTMAQKVHGDPEYRAALADPAFRAEEFRGIAALLRVLEHISVLVAKGGIAENLILAEYADTFVELWGDTRVAIVQRRNALGPYTGRAFEHLAMRARRYIESGEMEREYAALERDPFTLAKPNDDTDSR